ncbi:GNAT family N-acetyltransferase [Bordetella petrii]|uniref:GNAT family N-acetyltransferase n=1 Tax=Bordetella petrii TaxID=94624 RepID=UPI001E499237|nr:GNAT family N-acetyltransferase [Bordetella petrii]MCD0503860.1 GNAT family N-acetyltransferase [Bordetella petrii]
MTSNTPYHPRLDTERLALRPLAAQDAEALLAIFSDPQVMQYWNTAPWTSMADAHAFIADSVLANERQESLTLGIYEKSSGHLAGKCMLFNHDKGSRRAEIGFGLGRPHWGKGYINEAGRALIAHGFQTLKLRRIEAEIDPDNHASAKALERLGFVQEGLLRQRWEINGVVSDSALYGLLVGG